MGRTLGEATRKLRRSVPRERRKAAASRDRRVSLSESAVEPRGTNTDRRGRGCDRPLTRRYVPGSGLRVNGVAKTLHFRPMNVWINRVARKTMETQNDAAATSVQSVVLRLRAGLRTNEPQVTAVLVFTSMNAWACFASHEKPHWLVCTLALVFWPLFAYVINVLDPLPEEQKCGCGKPCDNSGYCDDCLGG